MAVVAQPASANYRTLYQLLAALSRASALEEVYDAALKSLLDATNADRAAVLLFDDDGVIRFKASRGLSSDYQAAVTGHTPWAPGTRNAQPLVVPDALRDENLAQYREALRREGIRALAFVPLALNTGVIGKFVLYYSEPHECTTDELEIAMAIATHVTLSTEHKRAELARAGSERRLQAILDNSAAVVFLKDPQGRYLLVNRRFEEMFQVTRENVLDRTDYDIFPAETAEQFRANDRAVVAAGKALAMEEHAPHGDGIHTYISMKFPLEGPDGALTGVCGIATDVTEQRQLEAASLRLAAIVENSDDAIISKDLNGIITSWNKGAERTFGYTAEEVIGKPIAMLAPEDHIDEMPDLLSRIRNGHRIKHYETRRRRRDGQIIDVTLTVSPVRDTAGLIIGASKIARDITSRKQNEQERVILLSRETDARQTADLLNRIGPRLATQLDLERLVQEVCDIATALVGAEFGSFFQHVVNERGESNMQYAFSGVPREDVANIPMDPGADLFGSVLRRAGVVRCDDVTRDSLYENFHPLHGMPEKYLSVRSYLAVPVVARSGEVLGGLFFGHSAPGRFAETHERIIAGIAAQAAIAIDNARLLEQARWAQTELKRSNEDLRRANRDLEIFAYSASHDLQEPLRTIAISAQLIERSLGSGLNGDDAAFLANILTAARRMSVLIQDLLAYTRATKYEEGQAPSVDAGRIFAEVMESLRGLIEEAGAKVTAGNLPAVAIHESRLAQLFQNLIGNAIKYRNKEAPCVHVTGNEQDGWCVFSVADNGIGIEPQFAEQIFGLFKRLHGRDEYPGSGIGLAICQRVVEQYGGRIWLERSAPSGGSTFCFALPSYSRREEANEPGGNG